jgi:hypothetical protein
MYPGWSPSRLRDWRDALGRTTGEQRSASSKHRASEERRQDARATANRPAAEALAQQLLEKSMLSLRSKGRASGEASAHWPTSYRGRNRVTAAKQRERRSRGDRPDRLSGARRSVAIITTRLGWSRGEVGRRIFAICGFFEVAFWEFFPWKIHKNCSTHFGLTMSAAARYPSQALSAPAIARGENPEPRP